MVEYSGGQDGNTFVTAQLSVISENLNGFKVMVGYSDKITFEREEWGTFVMSTIIKFTLAVQWIPINQ